VEVVVIPLLAALLGIPLWLIVGAVLLLVWHARQVRRAPDVFACKVRVVSGVAPGLSTKFPRRKGYANWVHDVLALRAGPGLMRIYLLPVAGLAAPVQGANPAEVKGLGENSQLLAVRLDNGAVVEIAVPETVTARLREPLNAKKPAATAP
jgi:hypothetical protein